MSFVAPPASHNEVPLTKEMLRDLLTDLSEQVKLIFGCKIRLFVHGGAVMILHPSLSQQSRRRTTRDVDYIRRAFGHEWRKMGIHDAETKLQICINATALRFRVGSDWMNADPDVALPFARNANAEVYDPIYHDSKQPNNVSMNTVFDSPFLSLIAVTPFWGVALKLVRYKKEDPTDIAALLRHGTLLNGVQWTPEILESWLTRLCWPMGYNQYQGQQLGELRDRIRDAVRKAQAYDAANGANDMQLVRAGPPASAPQVQHPVPPAPASADPFGHSWIPSHSNMSMQISPASAPHPNVHAHQPPSWASPSQLPPPPQPQPPSWEQPPQVQTLPQWHSSSHVPMPAGFVPDKRPSRHRESRRHRTPSPAPPPVASMSMHTPDRWLGSTSSSHPSSHSHSHSHSHPHSHLAAPPILFCS